MTMTILASLPYLLPLLPLLPTPTLTTSPHPLVMLIIYDGFRWDYLDMVRKHRPGRTPNFDRLIASGVCAKHAIPEFPTLSMPSLMTILTGLHSDKHGMVSNSFYDPNLIPPFYSMYNHAQNTDSRYFDVGSEPIWVTNQNAASDRHSGSTIFPNTLAAVKGVKPSQEIPGELYNASVTFKDRVDAVVEWFTDPQDPINLALFYYEEPDTLSHAVGPESTRIYDLIEELDRLTGYMLDELESHDLLGKVNLIFTSDHGSAYGSRYRTVVLDLYANNTDFAAPYRGPLGFVLPYPGRELQVYADLKRMEAENPQVQVLWKTDQKLVDLHFSDNDRIPPIVVLTDPGWIIIMETDVVAAEAGQFHIAGHGWDAKGYPEMWSYFIASGPAFGKGMSAAPIHLIDTYELMCHILGIDPAPNSGSRDRVMTALRGGGKDKMKGIKASCNCDCAPLVDIQEGCCR